MRFRSLALAAVLGVGLVTSSRVAADELVRVKLAYSATSDTTCPDPRGFRDLVTARMGYDPFRDDATTVVMVSIEPAKKGVLVGTVAVQTKRELVGREGECPELAQALAVALAIQLDPFGDEAAKAKAAPPPAPPVEIPSPPPPATPNDMPAPPPADASPSPYAEASISAMSTVGLLPFPALGASARFAVGQGLLSAGAGARYLTTAGDVTVGGDSVSGSLITGVLDGCATFSVVSGCVVATAGSFAARAETVRAPTTSRTFFFDLGARVSARVALLSRLSFEAFLEGRAPLTATELYVDGQTIFRSSAVTGTLGVGVVFDVARGKSGR